MNSRIYRGHVEHARLHPVVHRFRNRVTFYELDLTELDKLSEALPDFKRNRFATLSFRDSDYLSPGPEQVTDKLRPWITSLQMDPDEIRVTLVTSLRWFGRVFNPVSFYLLRDRDEEIRAMIAEVNNTFGDRHVYPVHMERPDPGTLREGDHPKEFHVSPFNDMNGKYQFTLRQSGDDLYIGVDLYRDGQKIIETWIEGEGRPLTQAQICYERRRHPLRAWLTMPRILWQALFLRFKHKLRVFRRPEPDHPHTLLSRKQAVK